MPYSGIYLTPTYICAYSTLFLLYQTKLISKSYWTQRSCHLEATLRNNRCFPVLVSFLCVFFFFFVCRTLILTGCCLLAPLKMFTLFLSVQFQLRPRGGALIYNRGSWWAPLECPGEPRSSGRWSPDSSSLTACWAAANSWDYLQTGEQGQCVHSTKQ